MHALAPKELSRLLPDLWERESCGTLDSLDPPEPYSNIIRVWGVLNDYRPQGQTRWSRVLVLHGVDARIALAAVLGLPAEDIRVKERAG